MLHHCQRRKLQQQNAQFAKEKQEIEETLVNIQKRTSAAVTMSLNKTKFLQAKLNEVKKENEKIAVLEAQLEAANKEISLLKSKGR